MHRIDHPTATNDNKFTTGNPQTAVKPTVVTADWANATQEEIAYAIESRGITLNKSDNTQLSKAIKSFVTDIVDNVVINNNVTDQSLGASFSLDITKVKSAVIDCEIYRKDSINEFSVTGQLIIKGSIGLGIYQIIPNLIGDLDELGLTFSKVVVGDITTINYSTSDFAGANYEGKMIFMIKAFKR